MSGRSIGRWMVGIFAVLAVMPAAADEVTCSSAQAYAERVAASRRISPDDKGCLSHELGRLDMRICNSDAAGAKAIGVATKGSGENASMRVAQVLEWSSSLEMKDGQGFGYNLSGLVLLGEGQAISVRYTDFWRDDPNVSNARQAPVDRVDIAQGPAGALACTGGAKPASGAVLQAVQQLHRPKTGAQQQSPTQAAKQ